MTHLWTLLSALLLVSPVAEPLSSPEENENEVLQHTEAEFTKNQEIENAIGNLSEPTPSHTPNASAPLTTTVSPSSSLVSQCRGNQVMLESSNSCGCPSGMVTVGDNCTCPVGFTLEGAAECKDVDECEGEALGSCGLHASCTNTPGSYSCSCLRGYLMGAGGCQDIDECGLAAVTGLQACQGDAECKNTPGSFKCSCPAGYVMAIDGRGCVDVDECSFEEQCRRELGNVCVNTPGSFICQCQPGFRAEPPACVGREALQE
ncbi:multiple epidermal growth factor-like domains protein 6 [Xiphias gladius]|uniref:multiple epidermal growth factor-like domains protein 6 n=1 Tax=Xiphias gladius TaxID=8245 RepID=UPI001A98DB03|nr:multiple epidermal growth factor-like domains protein 6 [Xiphias gladius]